MRIISLNTWGGRAGKGNLLSFFKNHADTTDVFCLQEIWSAPYAHFEGKLAGGVPLINEKIMVQATRDISAELTNHTAFFHPHVGNNYGLFMLVKNKYRVITEGDIFVYRERGFISDEDIGNHARNIQYVTLETDGGPMTIINFHGLWNGKGKGDSADRLEQSEKIIEFTKKLQNSFILCGDFNLLPDTKSIQKFEDAGLRNLIKEFGVTSTRTSHYKKPDKFADYAFISKNIILKDFKILPDEVSDHAPLLIEIQ